MNQNSANRVFLILSKAKLQDRRVATLKAWSIALNVSATFEDVAPLLIDMIAQLDEVERQIRAKFPANKADTSLKHFPVLRKAICFHGINSQWASVRELLSETVMFSLESLTHDVDVEPDVKEDDLKLIRQQLTELFELVERAEMSKKLRGWILNWLSAIRSAIDRYQINGTKGLQDALIRIQGEATFFSQAFERVKESDPPLYERLLSLFRHICTASDIAERCRKLCESPIAQQIGKIAFRCLEAPFSNDEYSQRGD